MKILYVSESFIPSQSANLIGVLQMCNALSKLGHSVTLIHKKSIRSYFRLWMNESKYILEHFGINSDIKLVGIMRLRYKAQELTITKCIKKSDLVYTRFPSVALISVNMGKKCILEMHEMNDTFNLRLVANSDLVQICAISSALKQDLASFLAKENDEIQILHDCVNLEMFTSTYKPLNRSRVVLGYFGSFERGRGLDILIAAFRDTPNFELRLYGGSKNQVRELREEFSGCDNVYINSRLKFIDVPGAMKDVDIFLMPFTDRGTHAHVDTTRWMSPLKMFEYMASGKPLISSKIEVLEEVLIDGENALLVKNYMNPKSWLFAVNDLVNDVDLMKKLTINARRSIEKNYTWDKRAQHVMKLID